MFRAHVSGSKGKALLLFPLLFHPPTFAREKERLIASYHVRAQHASLSLSHLKNIKSVITDR